jgi:hypothetical protein
MPLYHKRVYRSHVLNESGPTEICGKELFPSRHAPGAVPAAGAGLRDRFLRGNLPAAVGKCKPTRSLPIERPGVFG